MAETTTLKLPRRLKARIARLARQTGRAPHALMVEALEREVSREERMREFLREAMEADAAIDAGAAVYRAEDVHAWLERLAGGGEPRRKRRLRSAKPSASFRGTR
jgi:predicted transcriptional regulator